MNDFVAQLVAGEVVEPFSRAMTGDQIIRIDLLQDRDNLPNVGVVERRNDMETTDDGMHFLNAGRDLRLPNRINDAAMAAGGENNQILALDDEVGADLVLKIVRNEGTGVPWQN